jgi:RimJ/RimL family protein N-acetyltransferase
MYPTLETERLILRPWQQGDENYLLEYADVLNATIPDNELPHIGSLADARWIVEDNMKDDNQWVIDYKADHKQIGWLGIGGKRRKEQAVIWIWIDEPHWNLGFVEEALSKAVHFAFYGIGTKSVSIRLDDNNFHASKCSYNYEHEEKSAPKSPYSYAAPIRTIDGITYMKQPTEYLCGQAVIAMLAGVSVNEVIDFLQNDKGTSDAELKNALKWYGFKLAANKRTKYEDGKLPECAILGVKLPSYGHWSLYYKGKFYDPEFGVSDTLHENAVLRFYYEVCL